MTRYQSEKRSRYCVWLEISFTENSESLIARLWGRHPDAAAAGFASRVSRKSRPPVSTREDPPLAVVKPWSDDLAMLGANAVEPWMLELAQMLILNNLPTGVIVGSAVMEKVTQGADFYKWHLGDIEGAKNLQKPKGHSQPVWFNAF
jgi:hypothetical protein